MAKRSQSQTRAHEDAKRALAVVDSVITYMREGRGKPAKRERALFAAVIVFAYGVWENFVEQLVIEVASDIAKKVQPGRVPEIVRKSLEKSTAWELVVSPGWRELWIQKVKRQAVGGEGVGYGLNTAKAGQVEKLLQWAGVKDGLDTVADGVVPAHIAEDVKSASDALDRFVELRGEIVHSGAVPDDLRKRHVREWRKFVEDLVDAVDKECRKQRRALLA